MGRQRTGAAGIVHDQGNTERAPDGRHLGDGKHIEFGVGQGFAIIAAGARIRGAAEIFRIGRVHEAAFDAIVSSCWRQIPRPAIDVGQAHEIIARVTNILNGKKRRRCPDARPTPARRLRARAMRLPAPPGRVHDPRIDVADSLQRETGSPHARGAQLIGGGLVSRTGTASVVGSRDSRRESAMVRVFAGRGHGGHLEGIVAGGARTLCQRRNPFQRPGDAQRLFHNHFREGID